MGQKERLQLTFVMSEVARKLASSCSCFVEGDCAVGPLDIMLSEKK